MNTNDKKTPLKECIQNYRKILSFFDCLFYFPNCFVCIYFVFVAFYRIIFVCMFFMIVFSKLLRLRFIIFVPKSSTKLLPTCSKVIPKRNL